MDINGFSCLVVSSSFQLEENRDGREAGQGTAFSGSLLVASAVCVLHGDHISWQGALCTEPSISSATNHSLALPLQDNDSGLPGLGLAVSLPL